MGMNHSIALPLAGTAVRPYEIHPSAPQHRSGIQKGKIGAPSSNFSVQSTNKAVQNSNFGAPGSDQNFV